MKNRIIILLGVLAVAVSCNDVVTYKTDLPDLFVNSGKPSIEAIYDIYDAKLTNPLTTGDLAQIIHIKGKNLANPTSVSFNGIGADLSQCYCENGDSYILIPRVMPDAVDNKLVYTTPQGTATIDFAVKVPQLVLNGLANEYALPGSTVKVNGDFFDLFGFGEDGSGASIMVGETPVEIASVSEEAMYIVIPEGTPDNSLFTFSWNDVTLGAQTKKIPYRNTSYLFFKNFETTGFWDTNLAATILTDGTGDGDPDSLGYKFFRFKNSYSAWTWNSLGMGDGWYYDTPEDWKENWLFKCEVWTNPAVPIPAFDGSASPQGIIVQLNLKANVALDFGGVSYNTGGEWITYSCPLAAVASEMPANGDYWGFAFTVQPPVDWTVDFAFANFRIEPANY